MSDLLEILSRNAPCDHADINVSKVFAEAKAEIERLREQIEHTKQKHSLPLAGEIAEDGTIRFD